MRFRVLGMILGSLLAARTSSAQNLLANSQFNADVAHWDVDFAETGHFNFDPSRDADGSKASGSGALSSTYVSINGEATISQCVTGLSPGETIFWGTKLMFQAGQTRKGTAFMAMVFWSGGNCDGVSLGGYGGSDQETSDGRGIWLESGSIQTVPPGAHSGFAFVRLRKPDAGSVLTVNLDKTFVARMGSPLCNGEVPTLVGTPGPDELTGTPGTDIIAGLGGDDTIYGLAGDDVLCGGPGNDTIAGGSGDDLLLGEEDDDTLIGGKGDDYLDGGSGRDLLSGGPGDDGMDGGTGKDRCRGGIGSGDVADASCEKARSVP